MLRLRLPCHWINRRSYHAQWVRVWSTRWSGLTKGVLALCVILLVIIVYFVNAPTIKVFAQVPLALAGQQAASRESGIALNPTKVVGHGTLNDIDWSAGGNQLAIASSLGLYLYDPLNLQEINRVSSTSWIRQVNFNQQGNQLATVDLDGGVNVWNLQDLTSPVLHFDLSASVDSPIRTLAFSDDLNNLAVGYGASSLQLFDLKQGRATAWINLPNYPDTRQIEALAFSPDGKQLAIDVGFDIFLVDAKSGATQRILPGDHDIHHLAFSLAGPWLAADNTIFSLKDGSRVQTFRTFSPANIQAITYSPDGQVLAITLGSTVSLVDVATGMVLQKLVANGENIRGLKFNPDGRKVVAATDDNRLWIWEVITGNVLLSTDAFTGPVLDVGFSPDGSRFAAITSDHLWLGDAQESAVQETLPSPAGSLTHLGFNPNNLMLATAGDWLRLWNTSATILHRELVGHTARVNVIAFSPDGRYLVTAGDDHTVRIWNTESPILVNGNDFGRTLEADLPADIDFLSFSPDGSRLAGGSRRSSLVYVWDARNGLPLLTLNGPVGGLTSLHFSPDSSLLAVSGIGYRRTSNPLDSYRRSNTAYVWRINSGKLVASLGEPGSSARLIQFSRDGHIMLCDCLGDSKVLVLWRVSPSEQDSPNPLQMLSPIQPDDSAGVSGVLFSPDNKLLAVALADGQIEIWGTDNQKLLYNLTGHRGVVNAMAFRPDGKMLLSGGEDGILAFWSLP
jgi:WD40 repeat protein